MLQIFRGKKNELSRSELLLLLLSLFERSARNEVSLGEIHEAIRNAEDRVISRFAFFQTILYSPQVMDSLGELSGSGLIRVYTYRHDAFLPKTFVAITPVGRSRSKELSERAPPQLCLSLQQAVETAIHSFHRTWVLWGRPSRSGTA